MREKSWLYSYSSANVFPVAISASLLSGYDCISDLSNIVSSVAEIEKTRKVQRCPQVFYTAGLGYFNSCLILQFREPSFVTDVLRSCYRCVVEALLNGFINT